MRYSKHDTSSFCIRRSSSRVVTRSSRRYFQHLMKHSGPVLALAMMTSVTSASAQQDVARAWAAGCLTCHQPTVRALPVLHGQSRGALVSKMRAFRDGTRNGTVMPQIAKGYTDAQIVAIADWFAAQPSP
jgi:cytochrome c553